MALFNSDRGGDIYTVQRGQIATETINGAGIITLTDDCAAHIANVIFSASETIDTDSQIII